MSSHRRYRKRLQATRSQGGKAGAAAAVWGVRLQRVLADSGVASRRASLDFLAGASLSVMYFRYWNSLKFHSDVLESKVKFGF